MKVRLSFLFALLILILNATPASAQDTIHLPLILNLDSQEGSENLRAEIIADLRAHGIDEARLAEFRADLTEPGTEQAIASSTATASSYAGCLLRSGLITQVAAGTEPQKQCPRLSTQISWSILGPEGKQGPAGPPGEQGPIGTDGAQGQQGPAGPPGEQGPNGADGAQGQQGPTGPPGEQGPNGADGAQGQQGPAGPPGEQGPIGADGPQGPTGPSGALALAGQSCTTGQYVTGFDIDGNIVCEGGSDDNSAPQSWPKLTAEDCESLRPAGNYILSGEPGDDLSRQDFGCYLFTQILASGVNLSGSNLQYVEVNPGFDIHLNNANLSFADLSNASLFLAQMERTNFTGADLSGANLFGSIMVNADLTGANLTGADLTGVILDGVNLTGANLTGATMPFLASAIFDSTICPDGTNSDDNSPQGCPG
jgi:uncharacterized protein YjbI with pentapeptide repeats